MAKKSKSNDFAFFLGSELQETAARMRKINSAASAEAARPDAAPDTASEGRERSFQQVLLDALRSEASSPHPTETTSGSAPALPSPDSTPHVSAATSAPSAALPPSGDTGTNVPHEIGNLRQCADDTCSDTQVSSGVIEMTPVQTLRCHQVSSDSLNGTAPDVQDDLQDDGQAVPSVDTLPYSRLQERLNHVSTSPSGRMEASARPEQPRAEPRLEEALPHGPAFQLAAAPVESLPDGTRNLAAGFTGQVGVQASCLSEQVSSAVIGSGIEQTNRCHQVSPKKPMTPDDTSAKTRCSEKNKGLVSVAGIPKQGGEQGRAPSGALLRLMLALAERREDDGATVNLKRLADTLSLSHGTVRNLMSRLAGAGYIRTEQVRIADTHGVFVRFMPRFALEMLRADPALRCHQVSSGVIENLPVSIWEADETLIRDLWPHAARVGLEPAHLQQLSRVFRLQGWSADAVGLHLRYLDWALDAGEDVSLAGWLEQMRRQGTFPKPERFPE